PGQHGDRRPDRRAPPGPEVHQQQATRHALCDFRALRRPVSRAGFHRRQGSTLLSARSAKPQVARSASFHDAAQSRTPRSSLDDERIGAGDGIHAGGPGINSLTSPDAIGMIESIQAEGSFDSIYTDYDIQKTLADSTGGPPV